MTTIPPNSELLIDVCRRLGDLNMDELAAFDVLLFKLEQGKADHGPLDLASDGRDWLAEARQESMDRLWYLAFETVVQRRRRVPMSIEEGLRELRDSEAGR